MDGLKQRIKNQLIHNDFGEWMVLYLGLVLIIALAVRFAPEVGACMSAVLTTEPEVIEVYEGRGDGCVLGTQCLVIRDSSVATLPQNDIINAQNDSVTCDNVVYSPMALTEDEREAVELVVMSEAGCESREGKMLVAECILNAAKHDNIGVFEVFERYGYAMRQDIEPSGSVKEAVSAVFDKGERVTDEPIMFFYNPELTSCRWHETLCYVLTEGRHRFFKLW